MHSATSYSEEINTAYILFKRNVFFFKLNKPTF